jgi:hypothetical protein
MAKVEDVNKISPKVLVIVGGIAVVGLAVYEILKGGSTSQSQNASQPTTQTSQPVYTYQPTITPTITPNANPYYLLTPSIVSTPRASGGSVVYAPVEEIVSTYAPYTSNSVVYSPTTTTSNYSYSASFTATPTLYENEYHTGAFGTLNLGSPHNIGANQFKWGTI